MGPGTDRALAPDIGWLIAARAVQGAGAALIMPLGLALLSEAFPAERRGAAIGIFSAITSRSTSTPSGRSIATSSTLRRTSARHNARSPLFVMRERGSRQFPAVATELREVGSFRLLR